MTRLEETPTPRPQTHRGPTPPSGRRQAAAPFDAVACEQIHLRGRAVGLALSLGDRLQFFTTLEELQELDGCRFADGTSLLDEVRRRLG